MAEAKRNIEATRQGPGARLSNTREHEQQPRWLCGLEVVTRKVEEVAEGRYRLNEMAKVGISEGRQKAPVGRRLRLGGEKKMAKEEWLLGRSKGMEWSSGSRRLCYVGTGVLNNLTWKSSLTKFRFCVMSVKPHSCVYVLFLKSRVCAQEIELACLD